jgi:hypothetical protein
MKTRFLRTLSLTSVLLSLGLGTAACDKDGGSDNDCAREGDFPDFPDEPDSGGWPDTGDSSDLPDSGDDSGEEPDGGTGEMSGMMDGEACQASDDSGNESSDDSGAAGDDSGDSGDSSDSGDSTDSSDSADSGDSGSQGGLGDACTEGSDCVDGKCILSQGDSGFCTRQCVKAEDCPEEGWVCNLAPYTACVPDY